MKTKLIYISSIVKYLFPIILSGMASVKLHNWCYFIVVFLELLFVAITTNLILVKKLLGYIFNSIILLLINAQLIVLFFGSSYIALVMLTNIGSIQDISGKTVEYLLGIILVLVCSFLPIERISISKKIVIGGIGLGIVLEIALLSIMGMKFSPLLGYYTLIGQYQENQRIQKKIEESGDKTNIFYSESIGDYVKKPEQLPDKPNIILIFTEGLSQVVIDDGRNIMPNVADFQKQSISTHNYYNHTFATYRGIIGQLYSGYQLNNTDSNSLISIEEILSNNGYYTCFINTEPRNEEFSGYLNNLGFDDVISSDGNEGSLKSLSDKQAYEFLYKTIEECSKKDDPYFIAIYTFGTHVTFDSVDEKYGDGKDPFLNRFHDADYQFGEFYDLFKDSEYSDDTLLVYTADHCTYGDEDYIANFGSKERPTSAIEEMPLSIWYKGVEADIIEADGRNTLDLAPTLLDFIDIDAPNYFLGTSLYKSEGCYFDTVYDCDGIRLVSKDSISAFPSPEKDAEIKSKIDDYFIAKTQTPIEE